MSHSTNIISAFSLSSMMTYLKDEPQSSKNVVSLPVVHRDAKEHASDRIFLRSLVGMTKYPFLAEELGSPDEEYPIGTIVSFDITTGVVLSVTKPGYLVG